MRDLALAAGIVAVLGGGYLAFPSHWLETKIEQDVSNVDELITPDKVTTQQPGMVIEKNGKRIIMGKNGITIIDKNGDTTKIGNGGITRNGESIVNTGNVNTNTVTTVIRSGDGIKVTTTTNGETTVKEYKY